MPSMRSMPPHFPQVCALFGEIFEQCENINDLTERIFATHPEGFDDSARKVYNAALTLANQKIEERLEHVPGLDSAILTMTNCKEKVQHECDKMRFIFDGLALTLCGRVCLKPDNLKKFVFRQQVCRMEKLGKEKKKQNSISDAQETNKSRTLTPFELWARLATPMKGEEDKLRTTWSRMKKHDKPILFIIASTSNINNMLYEVVSGQLSMGHEEKRLTDALTEANEKIVKAIKDVEGIKSVVLSFGGAKEEESPEGLHVVQIGTEGKDGVCGIWIMICGDKTKAIQLAMDLTDVATGGEEAHRQRQNYSQKGFKQEMIGWRSAGDSVI